MGASRDSSSLRRNYEGATPSISRLSETRLLPTSNSEQPATSSGSHEEFRTPEQPAWDHFDQQPEQPDNSMLAICTDASRCGCAVYNGSSIRLIADRKDVSDPYRGLDMVILRTNPEVVIVSVVQKRLLTFLEKRFRMRIIDLARLEPTKSRLSKKLIMPGSNITKKQCLTPTIGNPTHLEMDIESDHIDHDYNLVDINLAGESTYRSSPNVETESDDVHVPVGFEKYDFKLVIVPNYWFSISTGFEQLVESELVSQKEFKSQEDKIMFVAARVNKSRDVCAVRSIGAIYSYITKHIYESIDSKIDKEAAMNATQVSSRAATSISSQDLGSMAMVSRSLMPIYEIRYVDPGPVLSIDKFTLESLSIFKIPRSSKAQATEDTDPDLQQLPTLYELLNECQSQQGKRQLHTIMLWPLNDSIAIRNRLDAVEFFMQPENAIFREELSLQVKSVVPLQNIFVSMNASLVTVKDLANVYRSTTSFVAIIDIIKERADTTNIDLLNRLLRTDTQDLRNMMGAIVKMVDFDESKRGRNVSICSGIDKNVDSKKEIYNNLTRLCNDAALKETATYRNRIGKLIRVIYVPRIGFLNAIDFSNLSELIQLKNDSEFDVLINTDDAMFFKTPYMRELDRTAGDIACELIDVQQDIIISLQKEILSLSDSLLSLMELAGELDCVMAFALVSAQRGYTRPDIIDTNEMDIRQGYHPLHSVRENVVANDVRYYKDIRGGYVKLMLITGPNSCGKTTYMKATCLIAYMAHIGCFVPAAFAQIPVLDAILTRMNSANSVSTGLSSFATDLHQINYALGRATEKSLIAIDEFGTGTRARDGLHLLKGLIMYLAKQGTKSPHVMITSHFTQLSNLLQQYMSNIIFKTFRVTTNLERNSIDYEFQVIDGIGEKTLADEVAARAGLPGHIIARAKQIREYIVQGRPISQRGYPPTGA